jgi:hypothetical protein
MKTLLLTLVFILLSHHLFSQDEEKYDKTLKALLDSIQEEDQAGRRQIQAIASEFGYDSPQIKELWKEIGIKDSLNLIIVENILQTRGWLGPELVGYSGSSTLFLVIQHSDQLTQEKYLPMMREASKKGDASRSNLALLEDRVLLGQGKRQIYGSQIGTDPETRVNFVLPIEDPENVDERRQLMDLGPLSDYTKYFDFTWDLEKHKLDTKAYEKKNKKDIKKKRKAAKKRGF